MNSIDEYFEYHKQGPSDIHEHLETLRRYADQCTHVTEMGVRTVVSTWAFLAARPRKLVCIDLAAVPIEHARQLAAQSGIELEFRRGDTAAAGFEIEETDLLFIDTWHVYDQLKRELALHAHKAGRYIILHDTTTLRMPAKLIRMNARPSLPPSGGDCGPRREEFLLEHRESALREKFTHNNGLTILARK